MGNDARQGLAAAGDSQERARGLLRRMLADYLARLMGGAMAPPLDGEVVLDLFAGTASLLVAAVMEGKVIKTYRWVVLCHNANRLWLTQFSL